MVGRQTVSMNLISAPGSAATAPRIVCDVTIGRGRLANNTQTIHGIRLHVIHGFDYVELFQVFGNSVDFDMSPPTNHEHVKAVSLSDRAA